MPRIDELNRLQEISHRASKVRVVTDAEIASLNLLAGALYSLCQAAKLDYDDSRASPNPEVSIEEFRRSVMNVSQGLSPDGAWLAGFYFNSALLRLTPLNERINKYSHIEHDIPAIRKLVNKIKHEPEAQMGATWHITLVDAVNAAELLCQRLENLLGKE